VLEKQGGVQITGKYMSPNVYEWAKTVATLVVVTLGWFVPLVLLDGGANLSAVLLVSGIVLAVVWGGLYMLIAGVFRPAVNVKMFPDVIQVGGRRYARDDVAEFRTELPRKVAKHYDKHGTMTPQQSQQKEVVMQYGERTVPIAIFRGRDIDKARALVMRLQAWHEGFNKLRKRDATEHAPARSHADEFGPAPDVR